jgi:hypothetical protein
LCCLSHREFREKNGRLIYLQACTTNDLVIPHAQKVPAFLIPADAMTSILSQLPRLDRPIVKINVSSQALQFRKQIVMRFSVQLYSREG